MRTKNLFVWILLVLTAVSCKNDDEPGLPGGGDNLAKLGQIAMVTEDIGDWDKAYLTPDGYFCIVTESLLRQRAKAKQTINMIV